LHEEVHIFKPHDVVLILNIFYSTVQVIWICISSSSLFLLLKNKVNNNPTKISLIKFSSFSSSSKYDRSSKILKHNYLQHIWSYLNQSKKYYIETSDDFNSLQSIHAESNLFNNLRVHSIIPYFLFHRPELSNQTFSTMIKKFTRPEKSFKTLIQHDFNKCQCLSNRFKLRILNQTFKNTKTIYYPL
jgi:hypothetical protein